MIDTTIFTNNQKFIKILGFDDKHTYYSLDDCNIFITSSFEMIACSLKFIIYLNDITIDNKNEITFSDDQINMLNILKYNLFPRPGMIIFSSKVNQWNFSILVLKKIKSFSEQIFNNFVITTDTNVEVIKQFIHYKHEIIMNNNNNYYLIPLISHTYKFNNCSDKSKISLPRYGGFAFSISSELEKDKNIKEIYKSEKNISKNDVNIGEFISITYNCFPWIKKTLLTNIPIIKNKIAILTFKNPITLPITGFIILDNVSYPITLLETTKKYEEKLNSNKKLQNALSMLSYPFQVYANNINKNIYINDDFVSFNNIFIIGDFPQYYYTGYIFINSQIFPIFNSISTKLEPNKILFDISEFYNKFSNKIIRNHISNYFKKDFTSNDLNKIINKIFINKQIKSQLCIIEYENYSILFSSFIKNIIPENIALFLDEKLFDYLNIKYTKNAFSFTPKQLIFTIKLNSKVIKNAFKKINSEELVIFVRSLILNMRCKCCNNFSLKKDFSDEYCIKCEQIV